jgi:flagellar hook assembly protein FlgD
VAPATTRLDPVYPNPSSGDTRIDYQLEAPGPVVLAVYDVLGRRLRTLVDGEQPAGRHTVAWDGRQADGSPVASGTYFVRMRTGTYASTQRVSLVR